MNAEMFNELQNSPYADCPTICVTCGNPCDGSPTIFDPLHTYYFHICCGPPSNKVLHAFGMPQRIRRSFDWAGWTVIKEPTEETKRVVRAWFRKHGAQCDDWPTQEQREELGLL